ncbi:MAG: DNA mismatch repair protein MutS [Acidobacteriota bacterium]
MENATPMLRQYLEIKKQYPGTLLFFRLGDFYELFNEDAVTGSRELQITLTARQKDSKNPIPMCGVPHHAASGYISRLIKKGYRVAICEQAEPAGKGTKLVRREVVRVITPGTSIDPLLTEPAESVFLASVTQQGDAFAAAFLELSTGEFSGTQSSEPSAWNSICDVIASYGPREILCTAALAPQLRKGLGLSPRPDPALTANENLGGVENSTEFPVLTILDDDQFAANTTNEILRSQFGVVQLSVFGLKERKATVAAAGACLGYALQTQRTKARHVDSFQYFERSDFMVLDNLTLRNLEIIESRGESGKSSLFNVLDETVTGMGSRLLRSWLMRPLIRRTEVQTRLAAVSELSDSILRAEVRTHLKEISDLERLIGRLNLGSATARDLISLGRSMSHYPAINDLLKNSRSLLLQVLSENIHELPEIRALIEKAIANDPPLNFNDGGTIREGFDAGLDEQRQLSRASKQLIAAFEERERERSGISSLKVRFNNVFGYYIEVTKGNLAKVPDDYVRRQTIANAERFTTPQLKEWEERVLGAEDRIRAIETEIFAAICSKIREETRRLQSTARALATLDSLSSLAEVAARRGYVAPVLHDGDEIEVKAGRHPIVEAFMDGSFVPNDIYLNNSTDRLLIITGANMGGKSTILRQVGLIQVLAQIGSFVPADAARLPMIDRIWTRVGASDDLASGRSTFMVEMTETASILHNSTPRSLVLLDEIGRGTSTFDGLSIAWAVAEFLHDSPEHGAKSLFATHYHELTELAENLSGAQNYQLAAAENDGEVTFLHRLQRGKSSKSFGIAVAKLAGLPSAVVDRAKDVLSRLEKYELAVFADEKAPGLPAAAAAKAASQISLFALTNEKAIDELRATDVEQMSPEDTKELLRSIKSKII